MSEPKHYVAIVKLHVQVNADYGTEPRQAVKQITPETTVRDLIRWHDRLAALGKGPLTIEEIEP